MEDPMPCPTTGSDAGRAEAIAAGEWPQRAEAGRSSSTLVDGWPQQPDRRRFRDRLRLALGPSPTLPRRALLIVKLDELSAMTDSYGSGVGDTVLRVALARLQHALRSGDVVRCLAADEIACLVTNPSTHESLGELAQNLFDAVAAPITVDPFEHQLCPSIGIATSPANGTTADALLKRANTAMRRAQRDGTPYAFFDAMGDT
jgi:two-component system CheB/CheR fusion protein